MRHLCSNRKQTDRCQGGFTLVELIVVLVILAILAALLVPSLAGYIDKANREAAIMECRHVVRAAQTIGTQRYGYGKPKLDLENDATAKSDAEEVLKLSEQQGGELLSLYQDEMYKVTFVVYKSKKGNYVSYVDGDYFLSNEAKIDTTYLQNLLINTIAEKMGQQPLDANGRDWASRCERVDSGAVNSNKSNMAGVAALTREELKKHGVDPNNLGATCWQYLTKHTSNEKKGGDGRDSLNWTLDEVKKENQQVTVIRLTADGKYEVLKATMKKDGDYQVFSNYQQTNKTQYDTYEEALKQYKKASKA